MNKIEIEGMEFYSYHGHFDIEKIVGTRFMVDLSIETDLIKAGKSDNLEDALDYQIIYSIVKKEMQIKSNLLENVAHRILEKFYKKFSTIKKAKVKISKLNPNMGGKIKKVSVVMTL